MYRTRFFGQAVGLCGAPERLVMPSGASVVRASVAILLDQPFGVVTGGEGADGVSDFVDGLEDTSVHDLLLEGSEQALDDAIGLRLSNEGVAWRDAPGADLFLESVRHEVAAVIMAQRQAAGGAGVDAAELIFAPPCRRPEELRSGSRAWRHANRAARRSSARRRRTARPCRPGRWRFGSRRSPTSHSAPR